MYIKLNKTNKVFGLTRAIDYISSIKASNIGYISIIKAGFISFEKDAPLANLL